MNLKGKTALVTGGARGIGAGISTVLAEKGVDLVINYYRGVEAANQIKERILSMGRRCATLQADVSSFSDIERLVKEAISEFGKIDILVNNAGEAAGHTPFFKVSEARWDLTLNLNLKGLFFLTQKVSEHMAKRGWGRIINISSCGGKLGFRMMPHYCASKGGVDALTRQMAVKLAPLGITVNAVAPGVVETPRIKRDFMQQPKVRDGYLKAIPVRRFGKPTDIGNCVAFLSSDHAEYITGNVIYVDGGWSVNPLQPEFKIEDDNDIYKL